MADMIGRDSGKMKLLTVLLCIVLVSFAQPANAENMFTTRLKDAVSSVYNTAVNSTFTIAKIEPVTSSNHVEIYFSDACRLEDLRRSLKLIPPAPIDWYNSRFSRQKNSLSLIGSFTPGQRYTIVLPPDFKSATGMTYNKGAAGFLMPDRDSDITFLEQGSVIERNSRQMLHVQIMNVNELAFHGLQIPIVLIPQALDYAEKDPFLDDIKNDLTQTAARFTKALENDSDFRPVLGNLEEDRQLFFSNEPANVYHQFSIPLTFRANKEKGTLELSDVISKRPNQVAQTHLRLLRLTDIGLTYKLSDSELLIWATSLYSGKPLGDIALFAFTSFNEVVPLGKTDNRGLLIVQNNLLKKTASLGRGNEGSLTSKQLPLNAVKIIAAASRDDRTYVQIEAQGTVKPEGIRQERLSQKQTGMLKGHIFTERGIYRPGETVHFKGTVREYKDRDIAAPKSMTVTIRVVNSKSEEIYNRKIPLSEFGTANDQLTLKTFFPLGTYNLQMKYGEGKDELAERSFEVQEFRQPRHFVEIIYKRESRKDEAYVNLDMKKELLNCEIAGKYYAGGPVKHGKVRWSIYHTKTDYNRPDYSGFSFGHPLESRTDLIESGEAMLDERGQIVVPVPIGKDVLSGKYGIEVTASVVDFDGRASSDSSVYQADPDYLVGISNHPPTVQPGENQTLYAVVIDRKGNKVSRGSVQVQVMERSYTYIQKRNAEGYLYNEQQQIWRSQLSAELPLKDDRAVFDFDFTRGGEYLIAFTYKDQNGREYASATKYSMPGYYDYEYDGGHREQPKNYGRLSLYAEKPLYTAGENIKVYVNPPREISTCLVTVEQGSLVEFFTYELKPGQQYFELPVKDSYNPNVYISVLATVPRSSFPVYTAQFDKEAPSFLFGTVNVEVKGSQQKIKITMNEEQKKLRSLPGAEMTLDIATTDQEGKGIMSEIAVAVVDESILSMTGYETPTLDILGKFLLPLGVFTGDLRLELLKQTPYGMMRNAPLTGGDGDEGPSPEAVSSKVRKDFNPVAYFNPVVRTDANGRATVKFTFPDSMTTYRVYAVACDKGSRFGTYQRPALVVKDFYMEPGLPAFFTRGDKFKFSVSAFNKTDRSGSMDFSVKPGQMLSLSAAASVSMASMDRTLIPVDGTAQRAGIAQVQFSGKFKDFTDIVEMKLPVNSGHVLGTDTVFGNVRKLEEVKYNLPKAGKELRWEDLGPEEVKVILTVSGSPFLRMSQGLRYFLHYPYGCVEQTSSGVLPLAALRGIIQKGLIPDITIAETDKFIKPGIDRLFSMQTSEGGFGYWPGDRTTHKWGSIYALTALTRAGLAGFEIPKDRLSRAMAYLQDQIKASGRDEHAYRAFGVYILALNKKLDNETFNKAYGGIDAQPREATMLVLMAAKMSRLLPDDLIKNKLRVVLEKPWITERFRDEFYARYREPAISLLAASSVLPNEEITHRLAAKLMGGISPEGIWTSTSDTSWSLIALSEYFGAGKAESKQARVNVKQSGKIIDNFIIDPGSYRTIALDAREFFKNPTVSIATSSDQALLYKLALTFPRTDYAKSGFSNGFEIHKTIKNTDGTNVIKVGDIVQVKLKINIKNRAPNYVVLDDPLPAGFVAINSAIKTEEAGIAMKKMKRMMQRSDEEGEEEGEESDGEFGEGFGWSEYYWDPYGHYRFTPNFFEIRNDRVVAFRNRAWNGVYEYSYYARAVCEGDFVMPSSKVQLMYDPEVVAYTPQGKVVIKGK